MDSEGQQRDLPLWEYDGNQPPIPPQYQQPVQDMGSTLSYGQGMGYPHYSQPSQPIPMLPQDRLRQLREERARRQQRPAPSKRTSIFPRKLFNRTAKNRVGLSNHQPQLPHALPGSPPSVKTVPLAQFSPVLSLPSRETASVLSADRTKAGGLVASGGVSLDSGMVQRVRIQRDTVLLTGAFIFSDVLGLVRTVLLTSVLGANGFSDAYFQAFLIPDAIFNMVAGGALGSAFIPVFTKYMVGENDEKTAWHVSSAALNLAITVMMVLALLAISVAGQIIPLYNPRPASMSLQDYTTHISLIISLARIMLLQAILLGGSVILSSILQAKKRFLLPAIASALYNVGIIAGLLPGLILLLAGHRNDTVAVYGASWGVVIGAALQVIIPLPELIKVGMCYRFTFDWRHPGIIQIARQMIPRIINAAMLSFSTAVDRYLISSFGLLFSATIVAGLVTQYTQALQLLLIPWSIFGATFATAAFPTLAENIARNRLDRYRATIMGTLRSILFLAIPSSIGLIVLGLSIIQVLFEHGLFTYYDAMQTVYPLVGFAIGLAGLSALEILTRSFYALRDSKTPVIISVIQFVFKIALSIILISLSAFGTSWGIAALAFSTSVATTLEAVVLLLLLQQRIGGFELRNLARFIVRVLLAAAIMGLCILVLRLLLDWIVPTAPEASDQALGVSGTIRALSKLILEVFVGLFVYLRVARLIGIEELEPVRRVLQRFKLTWI